jgi:hypothetical protein
LKLLKNGIPYDAIDEMEASDFSDWMSASRALDLQSQLEARYAAVYGQQADKKAHRARVSEMTKLENQQKMYLGVNPYEPDKELIRKSWDSLKGRKVKKTDGSQRDKSGPQP